MESEKDYEEFLELSNKHNVKYCIVDAFALAFHAEPRYTKSKEISNRPQDKADLARLQEYD